MVGKRAFVLFVFKFEERGRNSVATGNMGDGAVSMVGRVYGSSMGECMGATTSSNMGGSSPQPACCHSALNPPPSK